MGKSFIVRHLAPWVVLMASLGGCLNTGTGGTSLADAIHVSLDFIDPCCAVAIQAGAREFSSDSVRREWLETQSEAAYWEEMTGTGDEGGFPDGRARGWSVVVRQSGQSEEAILVFVQDKRVASARPSEVFSGQFNRTVPGCDGNIEDTVFIDSTGALESARASGKFDYSDAEVISYSVYKECWMRRPVMEIAAIDLVEREDELVSSQRGNAIMVDPANGAVLATNEEQRASGIFILEETGSHSTRTDVMSLRDTHEFTLENNHTILNMTFRMEAHGPSQGAITIQGPEGVEHRIPLEVALGNTTTHGGLNVENPRAGNWTLVFEGTLGVEWSFEVDWCAPGWERHTPCADAHREPWFDGAFALRDQRRQGYDTALSAAIEGRSGD